MNKTDIVLFMYNLTDAAVLPWLEAGHVCVAVDIQHPSPCEWREWNYMTTNIPAGTPELAALLAPFHVSLVVGFPPCNDLASSGAAHFARKRLANPNYLQEAMALVHHCTAYGAPYVVENPVGQCSTQWRKPDTYVHPYEYGGWLEVWEREHPEWPEYIAEYDAYPKKTGLWIGNGAQLPVKRPVPLDAGYSAQYRLLGGKSQRTKNIRSATPRGMARGIFEANKHILAIDSTE